MDRPGHRARRSGAERALWILLPLLIVDGCSSSNGAPPTGTGGNQSAGGATAGAGGPPGLGGQGAGGAAPVPTPPSCRSSGAGLTDCGSAHDSCCTSVVVSGGAFHRTYTNGGSGPSGEADPATVSSFRLDKYLVTVGRFRQFVTAWSGGGGYVPAAGSGKHAHLNGSKGLADSGDPGAYEPGWVAGDESNLDLTIDGLACSTDYATWTSTPGNHEDLPINCVNWWEAYAFCIWDGGFLPSEAEYAYAAAGGSAEREYPWGSTAPGTANQYAIYDCNYPGASGGCSTVANIAPVGAATQGAGAWGQLDLVGDLSEWVLDWFAPYVSPCTDCANFTSASGRVNRGGYFVSAISELVSAYRNSFYPTNRFYSYGFRCARTP